MKLRIWVGTFDPWFYKGLGWVQSGQGREGFYLWTEVTLTPAEEKLLEETFLVPDSVKARAGVKREDYRCVTR